METNNTILNELKEVSPAVANIDRRNVYNVPSGYFNELAAVILNRVKQSSEEVVLKPSATPFIVPQDYFNGLSSQILSRIKQHHIEENEVVKELAEIAPFLNTIKKEIPYSVPTGYFENLQPLQQKPAKVVSFNRTKRFVRYAAAAAITGIMAIGGVLYMNDRNVEATSAASFKQDDLKNLSEQEIIEYLNANSTTGVTLTGNVEKVPELKQTKELTDEEILNYLNENPEPGDAYQQEG